MKKERHKVSNRTCIGCGKKTEKSDLIRIVKKNDLVYLDERGKERCRGAYICLNDKCVNKAVKKKKIDKALRVNINNNNLEKLLEEIKKYLKLYNEKK